MMQYLVILLDDTSVSYCHADNPYTQRRLINLDDLKAGILYAMKENLMIQFVYPDYELPQEYLEVIDTIDHHDIKPVGMGKADVVVLHTPPARWATSPNLGEELADAVCVLRVKKEELLGCGDSIAGLLPKVQRLNIVITDVETFTDEDLKEYNALLDMWAEVLKGEYLAGHTPQLNLLTDRMMLTKPNHCNAGVENITLAPNGKYYLCPAFYYSNPDDSIDPQIIKNQQLLRLDHAPLCRHCDAYQCRRCVWLNRKTTCEVNTPSHEQCVVAHAERNAARRLLDSIRAAGEFMPEVEIKEINYTDPFEIRKEW
ncbi:MAG: CXXX repeat peptide maturase [Bacteroidales bacterium]|nr:CXXX repeat peptide maturase [Bacteroidales bacterium]